MDKTNRDWECNDCGAMWHADDEPFVCRECGSLDFGLIVTPDVLAEENEELRASLASMEKDREELREMATELKRMHAAYLHADSVGCAVEWHSENGEDYRKLEAALMDKLTRDPSAKAKG